jgi:hypothetical protein
MVLSTFAKIAFFPVWILWKGYAGLWWAFDDAPTPRKPAGVAAAAAAGGPAQDTSFQVFDSMPKAEPRHKPLLALRLGFAASLVGSAMLGAITGGISEAGHLTPQHAAMAWAWGSLALFVGSVWSIARARRVPKAHNRAESRRGFAAPPEPAANRSDSPQSHDQHAHAPAGFAAAVGAAVNGSAWGRRCKNAKSAARTAGTLAANTCRGAAQTCKTAAKIARPGVEFAWSSAKSAWKKAAEQSKKA